jgi:transposase
MKEIMKRHEILTKVLNEHGIRLTLAAEALAIGRGGITQVHEATGVSRKSIALGIAEINGEVSNPEEDGRIRRKGGGRKKTVDKDPAIKNDLELLVNGTTRGDPESPLLWTTKSVRKLSAELSDMGHAVSHRMVNELLWEMGYSLQSNRKKDEGGNHPDRDAQFRHIDETVTERMRSHEPVISVDTKKKELVGNYKNSGREWHEKKNPTFVNVYDFIGELGKVSPYGVYDIANDMGWVNLGITHDTAEFAVESIRKWWYTMGAELYPDATGLYITADGGGSNGSRVRLWKTELQKFATEIGLVISVSHFPPGTSKWNKIEHRLFSIISMNWRERPLLTYETIVNLISSTTTTAGLRVRCDIDERNYEKGRKITDEELSGISISRDSFHGDWNYTISPQN